MKPDPDDMSTNAINNAANSSQNLPPAQFYELKESIADIQNQIVHLQNQVKKYDDKAPETNYTEKLKELIDRHPSSFSNHQITLKNGSIIEGTIEKDQVENIMVKTKVGTLTIAKKEIDFIQDLVFPVPDIVFIGHGQEQVLDSIYIFTGKVLNQGGRRGDFVRVIYQLWGEDTQIISADSIFISGSEIRYKSGIVTDTALEPNQATHFSVQVPIDREIPVSYITRNIRWLVYD